jgi:hypothetical protein
MKLTLKNLFITCFLFVICAITFSNSCSKIDRNLNIEKSQKVDDNREKITEKESNPWCGDIINIQQPDNPYKKIVSFVIYQKNSSAPLEKWIEMGILDNENGKRAYFPEWVMRAYIIHPSPNMESLLFKNNWEIVRCIQPSRINFSMLFRFLVYDDNPWMFISRDIDSRLSPRELFVVNEWINSDYIFHTIRDHKQHSIPVLGGMFGMRRGAINGTMSNLIQKALNEKNPIPGPVGEDQNFLKKYVWPQVSQNALEHDSQGRCFGAKECRNFPKIVGNWTNKQFIGSPFKFEIHIEPNCNMTCEYK